MTGEDGVTFGKHVNKALPARGPEVSLHKAPRASHATRCEHSKHSRKDHQGSTDIETDLFSRTLSDSQRISTKSLRFSFPSQLLPIHPVTLGTSFSQHLPSNHNHRSSRLPIAISGSSATPTASCSSRMSRCHIPNLHDAVIGWGELFIFLISRFFCVVLVPRST